MRVIVFGKNDGRLGLGERSAASDKSSKPTHIPFYSFVGRKNRSAKSNILGEICSVDVGSWHSGAIDSEGKLYMWGTNSNRRCGIDTNKRMIHTPTMVRFAEFGKIRVHQISCGDSHTLAIATNDRRSGSRRLVFSWGNNRYGRLGHGDEKMRSRPTVLRALTKYGAHVTRVAAGGAHSFALFDPKDRPRQNSLFGWGMNHDMQIGHVLTTS